MSLFEFAAQYDMFPRGSLVLCALSGGADSMYLAANLLAGMEQGGYRLAAAHYDHCLRGERSQRDAQFVRDWCQSQGIPCVLGRGDVAARAKAEGKGLEETAREMRYAFLEETAAALGADVIATAHTADDNGETLLLNLVRGSGLQGLCAIPPRRDNLVRPMLTTTREEVERWLAEHHVPHVEDESNQDLCFTRNRVRKQVLPILKELNPRVTEHLSQAICRLREDESVLQDLAQQALEQARPVEEGWSIPCGALTQLPRPVALRALRALILRCGGENVAAAHLEGAYDLLNGECPSSSIRLPRLTVRREYEALTVVRSCQTEQQPPQPVKPGESTLWCGWEVTCTPGICPEEPVEGPDCFWLDPEKLRGPLTVRSRQVGDHLRLRGRSGKSVKKWMIQVKVPRHLRDTLPVLADGAGVAAVAALGPEESRLALPGRPGWHLTLRKV